MADYKPSGPFNVPAILMVPTETTSKGVKKKVFVPDAEPFFCTFRTFGGTEKQSNDVVVVENTAVVETWFDPRIKSNCNVKINNANYEILGTPENINMRNQYLVFKIRAIEGGA